jgi:hypothetical protein
VFPATAKRPKPDSGDNRLETLPEELPVRVGEILPIFNDSCPNFVSNVRLKLIHVFEGSLYAFTASKSPGVFDAA